MSGRRAILQIMNGRDVFRKIVLDPGQAIRIGDGNWAHEVIIMTTNEGARGVDVLWDGLALRIDGIGPAPWFYLNGRSAFSGELLHRQFFQIGGVQLRLTLEGFSYDEPIVLSPEAQRVREALRGCPHAYAIVDAARDRRILECLEDAVDPHRSLYEGIEGRTLDDVAPYLVCFDPSSLLCDVLLAEGWGDAWGIFLGGDVHPEYARRHFRRFLMVDDETGRRLYFRFYDPRVLNEFLPIAADWQRDSLLSPFDLCVYENEMGEPVIVNPQNESAPYPPPPISILAEQSAEMLVSHRKRIVQRIQTLLHEHYSDWVSTYDDVALSAWILQAIARGEHYGITDEQEAVQMVLLWMVLGPDPETRLPWVADILSDPDYETYGRPAALIDAARKEGIAHIERAVLSTKEISQ